MSLLLPGSYIIIRSNQWSLFALLWLRTQMLSGAVSLSCICCASCGASSPQKCSCSPSRPGGDPPGTPSPGLFGTVRCPEQPPPPRCPGGPLPVLGGMARSLDPMPLFALSFLGRNTAGVNLWASAHREVFLPGSRGFIWPGTAFQSGGRLPQGFKGLLSNLFSFQ